MSWGNFLWWFLYTCLAVILQSAFAGLDFFLPGLIVAIQERRPVQLLWVLIVFCLMQEGMGSMAFGGSLLWYGSAVALFYLGYSLFEVENFLFIFLLSGCLVAMHLGIAQLMASLQNIPLNSSRLLEEGVFQALLTPFIWRAAQMSRGVLRNAH